MARVTNLFVQQPQCILDVRVLQGDGRSPLGEEQSEDEVDDVVEAASDELRVQTELGNQALAWMGGVPFQPTPDFFFFFSFLRVCVCNP